jgi:uncharacterized protein (DUF433 family)/predicted nuclease of predicted toxin-antitoxin system
MEPKAVTTWKYLAPNPKSAYTQLFIAGRRIRARTLYGAYMSAEEPMTPEEIAADYDLPLAAVEEAIAYCKSDPPEIRIDFEREERIPITDSEVGTNRYRPRRSREFSSHEALFRRRHGRRAAGETLAASRPRHHAPRRDRNGRKTDLVQLTRAIREGRAILTKNYDDFLILHELVAQAKGVPPGVIAIRQKNDSTRDLTPKGIVNALRKLEASGAPVENQYIVLNHWR